MRKAIASFAVLVCALFFTAGAAEAQVVNIKGGCVYQTLLMCKSIKDDKGNIYDLTSLRKQPNAGQRIDLVGQVRRGGVGRCGTPLAWAAWKESKGPAIFCLPVQLF